MLNVGFHEKGRKLSLLKRCCLLLLFFAPSVFACHWYDVRCLAREAEERAKDLARGVEQGIIATASILDLVGGENRTLVRTVHTSAPLVEGGADWMSRLSDEILLSKLTIPGTHDSGTGALHLLGVPPIVPWPKLCPSIAGKTFCINEDKIRAILGTNAAPGAFVETQYWTVAEQLANGIRFLDIRVDGSGSSYTLHHGVVPLGDFHQNVMRAVSDFLGQHPREVVFMSVKEENSGKLDKSKFVSEVVRGPSSPVVFVTEGDQNSVSKTLAETKLKDVRGKVVLFNRMGNASTMINGRAVGGVVWGDQHIQDKYENDWGCHFENTSSIPWTKGSCDSGRSDKTKALLGFFDSLDTSGTKFNINFASAQMNINGQATAMDIVGNARTQNGALLTHFKTKGFRRDAGQIIVMDYPAYMVGESEPNELLKLIITRANQGK